MKPHSDFFLNGFKLVCEFVTLTNGEMLGLQRLLCKLCFICQAMFLTNTTHTDVNIMVSYLLTLRSLSRLLFLLAELLDRRVFLPTEDRDASRAPAALCAERSRQQMNTQNPSNRVLELQQDINLTWSGRRRSKQSVREQLQAQVLLDGPAFLAGEPISLCGLHRKLTLGVRSHDDRSNYREHWGENTSFTITLLFCSLE